MEIIEYSKEEIFNILESHGMLGRSIYDYISYIIDENIKYKEGDVKNK